MRLLLNIAFLAVLAILSACGGCDEPSSGFDIDEEDPVERTEDGPQTSRFCEGAQCDCAIGPTGGFCRTKFCGLVVEPQTLNGLTVFEVSEGGAPDEIRDELLGGRVCEITVEEGTRFARPFQAALYYEEDEVPGEFREDEVVAVHIVPDYTLAIDSALEPDRDRVLLSEEGNVTYGATVLPAEPIFEDVLGEETFALGDGASYIRNLSQHDFGASFHDGQRFYVGNGPRVMIWNEGVPADPMSPPDLVLGTPDLSVRLDFASSSSFEGNVRSIWSDGTRMAVSMGHRVLIWNQIPTESFASADLVLGQDEFTSNEPNRGGAPASDTLASPAGIWSDGTRLIVADRLNHRFLVWNEFPVVNGQPADFVIGQPGFEENRPGGGEINAYEAWGAYFDGSRLALTSRFACECFTVLDGFPQRSNPAASFAVGLPYALSRVDETTFAMANAITGFGAAGVAMRNGHRVSVWNEFPSQTEPADFTLGKPDDTIGGILGRLSASSFGASTPFGHVWSGEGYVFVGDGKRLLVWDGLPESTFEAADLVFGQPGFTTDDEQIDFRAIGRQTLAYPTSVSAAGDVTVIADRGNNRVTVVRGDLEAPESIVTLGQPDGVHFAPNGWGAAGASTLDSPGNVFTDGTRLFVSDAGNHRVLIWNEIPGEDGAPADVVLGQADMAGTSQNRGGAPDAGSLHYPAGVHYDGRLFVADAFNHRVLVWNGLPTENGAPADDVIGQPNFTSAAPNHGLGWYARDAASLARPMDVTVAAGGGVVVADAENNRVVVFDETFVATSVLGQVDFVTDASPNYLTGSNIGWPRQEATMTASATTLRRPAGVAWDAGRLVVADTGNHRLLQYTSLTTGAAATDVRGQPGFDQRAANESAVGPSSVRAPEGVGFDASGRVLVADTGNHRILAFGADTAASLVFGQAGFERNGINGSSAATGTLEGPGGLALADETLWVADRRNHRVVAYEAGEQTLVLGQTDPGGDFRNAGFAVPEAWTFATPTDVWTDGTRLVVADRDNHRVSIWNEVPQTSDAPADVVVGQVDFGASDPNGGAGPTASAATLLAPQGVFVKDDVLYVADTGNNRVLVFDPVPTANGVSATRVLCQAGFDENRANRGGTPTAATCAGPTDIIAIDGRLYVADTGNHRVLRFAGDQAAADLVLGQPDFETRGALGEQNQPAANQLSSPSRLDYDGTNFYVVDRGNHRVLIWDALPTENQAPADRLLGQIDFDTGVVTPDIEGFDAPFGIAVQTLPFHSSRVYVADSGKNRVVSFRGVYRVF